MTESVIAVVLIVYALEPPTEAANGVPFFETLITKAIIITMQS